MSTLFADGRIVDLILGLMLGEAALLAWLHARTGAGVPPGQLLPNLLAGAFLLLALRSALNGGPWFAIASWLLLGLLGHLADLALRWRGAVHRAGR